MTNFNASYSGRFVEYELPPFNKKALFDGCPPRKIYYTLNTKTKNKRNSLIRQGIDLAKLSQNLLKGEEVTSCIKRSMELIK